MDFKEFQLHSARRQLIKTVAHLNDARHHLLKTFEHIDGFALTDETTLSIEANINYLVEGINETIKFSAIAADHLKQQMKDPDDPNVPPIEAGWQVKLTPFQRQLQMQGVKFDLMPKFEPTKRERKIAQVIKSAVECHTTKRQPPNRITKNNPPIC